MKKYSIKENQDMTDVSIQLFGGVEYMFDALAVNKTPGELIDFFVAGLPVANGSNFNLSKTEKIGSNDVVSKFNLLNFVVDNNGSGNIGIDEGFNEGIGFWIVENDFVVQ